MKLDAVFDRVIFADLPCLGCGEVGKWEAIQRYSDNGGMWELECIECEGIQYQNEYELKYFECPQCGEQLEICSLIPCENFPNLLNPEFDYCLHCPNCDNWIDNDNFVEFSKQFELILKNRLSRV